MARCEKRHGVEERCVPTDSEKVGKEERGKGRETWRGENLCTNKVWEDVKGEGDITSKP